jgi:hypothetical protein
MGSRRREDVEQVSQWEIKQVELKDVKSCQAKVKDFIREMSCGIIKESRSNKITANRMIEEFNKNLRVELQDNLDDIPDEIKGAFKYNIDILVEQLETAYDESLHDYGRLYADFTRNKWNKIRREMGKEDMKKYLNMLEKEGENIKEAQEILRPFQEAREEYKKALNYVWQDCKPFLREIADRKIDSAMESYGRAVLQKDQQESDLAYAKEDIEDIKETTEWLKKEAKQLEEVVRDQIDWYSEEIRDASRQYGQCSEQLSQLNTKKRQYTNEENEKSLDEWRKDFEDIHGNMIDKLPISVENKKILKEYQKFIFFYRSIYKIYDYKIYGNEENTKKKFIYDKNLYSQKIKELMNNSGNGIFHSLKSRLLWNDTTIDDLRKQLEGQFKTNWQSLTSG